MSIGDRMKMYEAAYKFTLTPRSCLFIRVDGKAFHTYTRGMKKPFDIDLINAMNYAAMKTAEQMQGFKLAYIQSDEATFMLTDFDTLQSQGWFGYELNKIVSISASLFTGFFNSQMSKIAFFDSRAFIVPESDAPNVFVWRQRDWERNSIQMLAQSHFSPKQLHKKSNSDMHEMLFTKNVNWADLTPIYKNGTFINKDMKFVHERLNYEDIKSIITIPEVT